MLIWYVLSLVLTLKKWFNINFNVMLICDDILFVLTLLLLIWLIDALQPPFFQDHQSGAGNKLNIKIKFNKNREKQQRSWLRPGLLLLDGHGRSVVGAPKLNTELGQILKSTKTNKLYLKTIEFKNILTKTAQKSSASESSPGSKTKIPGLDITSKQKKVRDSILHVPEVLPEKGEETWKRYHGRGFIKNMKKMKEEQDEKILNEFRTMVKKKEEFPNWEIVKRRPKKTQKVQNDGQKTMESMNDGGEQEQDEDEEEKEEWNEPIKNRKTMKNPSKSKREEEEEAWNELLDMVTELKVEEIVKRRPKRTPRKKVSYQFM